MTDQTMTAIGIEGGKGPAEALRPETAPIPVAGEGDVLIRVTAAGVNRPDIVQRLGAYPPPPGASPVLGLEVAGEVVEGAGRWKAGDLVCALLGGGGYAEYAVVDARHALPIPKGLSLIEAAGLPETVFTVYANVFEHGALKAGETLMIHGATSGIGVTAIQMAKAAGAKVIATGRGADKKAQALSLGADVAVDVTTEDFEAVAKEAGGVDVVLDMVGGSYVTREIACTADDGRIVLIALLGGAKAEVPLGDILRRRITLTGSTLRPRPVAFKAAIAANLYEKVWPLLASGRIKPVIHEVMPAAQAAQAHALMESSAHIGKIMLVWD